MTSPTQDVAVPELLPHYHRCWAPSCGGYNMIPCFDDEQLVPEYQHEGTQELCPPCLAQYEADFPNDR